MSRPIDKQTVDQLVVQHLPTALSFARRLTGDADLAEEVVQEALCRVLRRWKSYRGEAEFSTWLLQIVVNVDRDRRRSRRPLQPLPTQLIDRDSLAPNQQMVAAELQERIRASIEHLPDRQREVAVLCLGEKLTAVQTAKVLQISEANVHTCLHLARKRIAKAIGIDFAQPESS